MSLYLLCVREWRTRNKREMKGQDIVIFVWIASEEATGNKEWVIRDLASDLNISTSTVHSSLSRMEAVGLYDKRLRNILLL